LNALISRDKKEKVTMKFAFVLKLSDEAFSGVASLEQLGV